MKMCQSARCDDICSSISPVSVWAERTSSSHFLTLGVSESWRPRHRSGRDTLRASQEAACLFACARVLCIHCLAFQSLRRGFRKGKHLNMTEMENDPNDNENSAAQRLTSRSNESVGKISG